MKINTTLFEKKD